jgi:hypothetical protein
MLKSMLDQIGLLDQKHQSEAMDMWYRNMRPDVIRRDAEVLSVANEYSRQLVGSVEAMLRNMIYVRNIVHKATVDGIETTHVQEIASWTASPAQVQVGRDFYFHWTANGTTPNLPTDIKKRRAAITGIAYSQEYRGSEQNGFVTIVREVVYLDNTEVEFRTATSLFPGHDV